MTETFTAEVDAWVRKTEQRMKFVTRESTKRLIQRASRTAPGKMRGGEVKVGFVPRDTGFLAASLMSTLFGSTILTRIGEDSYSFVVAGMEAGDVATFIWTAAYARRVHYEGGWLWVDDAAANWQPTVRQVSIEARARVR